MVITSPPATAYNNQVLTLGGTGFGLTQGSVYVLGSKGAIYPAVINVWADTSIQFYLASLPTTEQGEVTFIVIDATGAGDWSGHMGPTIWGAAPLSVGIALNVDDEVFGIGKGWNQDAMTYVSLPHFAGQKPRGRITNVSVTELGINYTVRFFHEDGDQSLICEINGLE